MVIRRPLAAAIAVLSVSVGAAAPGETPTKAPDDANVSWTVTLSSSALSFERERVMDMADAVDTKFPDWKLVPLFDALVKARGNWQTAHPTREFRASVTIRSDEALPAAKVTRVMHTCRLAVNPVIRLGVHRETGEPSAEDTFELAHWQPCVPVSEGERMDECQGFGFEVGLLTAVSAIEVKAGKALLASIPIHDPKADFETPLGAALAQIEDLPEPGPRRIGILVADDVPNGALVRVLAVVRERGLGPPFVLPRMLAPLGYIPEICHRVDVEKKVRENQSRVAACYETALATNPELVASVKIVWRILPDGVVGRLVLERNEGLPDDVARCVLDVIASIRFTPPDGGICQISYPFTFAPAGAP